MEQYDIPVDYKLCISRRSPTCIKAGHKNLKWKGRVCSECYKEVRAAYYTDNKQAINKKIVEKRRDKKIKV